MTIFVSNKRLTCVTKGKIYMFLAIQEFFFDMKLAKSHIKRINTCRKRDKMFNHKKILMVRGTLMPLTCPLMMLFSILHDKPAISG